MKVAPFLFSIAFVVLSASSEREAWGGVDDPLFRVMPISEPVALQLGRGIDIITGAPRGDCVVSDQAPDPLPGQDAIAFQSSEVSTLNELNQDLGVSASAEFKGGFGGASASASYAKSLAVQDYSYYYFVRASLAVRGKSLLGVHFKDSSYEQLLKSSAPDALQRFRNLCGDGYISEFAEGGEFEAVISIATSSRRERDAVSASVSGSANFASGSASFTNTIEMLSKTNEVHISTYRRSGDGQPIAMNPADIQSQVSTLPAIAKSGPVPLRMGIFSYITIIKDQTTPIEDLSEREEQIRKLAEIFETTQDRLSEITYIIGHPNEFYSTGFDLPALAEEANALREVQSHVEGVASDCIKSGGACSFNDVSLPPETARPGRK